MFADVKRDILDMVETAQILMNVRSQMNAISMLCVPIQRVLMSVDVEKVLKAMEETAQPLYLFVPHLVVKTLSAKKKLQPLLVFVKLVTTVTDITAQILMSARFLRIMNVILMPCVLTLMARIFVGALEATKEMAEYALISMNAQALIQTNAT